MSSNRGERYPLRVQLPGGRVQHAARCEAAIARSSLRDRIAEALANWSMRDGAGRGLGRLNATVRANAERRADAVLAVVGPELDRLQRWNDDLREEADHATRQADAERRTAIEVCNRHDEGRKRAEAEADRLRDRIAELKRAGAARHKAAATLRLVLERLDQLEAHWHNQPYTEAAAQVRAALADIRDLTDGNGGEQP